MRKVQRKPKVDQSGGTHGLLFLRGMRTEIDIVWISDGLAGSVRRAAWLVCVQETGDFDLVNVASLVEHHRHMWNAYV